MGHPGEVRILRFAVSHHTEKIFQSLDILLFLDRHLKLLFAFDHILPVEMDIDAFVIPAVEIGVDALMDSDDLLHKRFVVAVDP